MTVVARAKTFKELALGPHAAVDLLQTYTAIDFSRVWNFQNRQGLTGQQILTQAYTAVGAVNAMLLERYGSILYTTTDDKATYRQGDGTRSRTNRKVEFAISDPVRTAQTGHSLPLWDYEDVLAWGEFWLRDAKQSDIDSDLELIIERWQNRVEDDVWQRIFTMTENPIGTGYDVPWAIGTGVNAPYIPNPYSGNQFDTTHTHFKWISGVTSANVKTLLDSMVTELRHHGYSGELQAFVSEADVDKYVGMQGFVALLPNGFTIVPGNGASSVQVTNGTATGMPGEIFGYYNSAKGVVALRWQPRIPTGYIFLTKSFGNNNPSNGLALRLHPDVRFGLTPKPQVSRDLTPEMEFIQLKATHGIGTNRRLNGVAGYFAASISAYANPTFN